MACGRRLIGPRRVVLMAFFEGGARPGILDDAIDTDAMGGPVKSYTDYRDSLYDEGVLRFIPGLLPTWWTIRPLTAAQVQWVSAVPRTAPYQHALRVIQCGLVSVENYPVVDEHGATTLLSQPERVALGRIGDVIADRWLETHPLTESEVLGLAAMIDQLSEARPSSSRPSAVPSGPGAAKTETATSGS